MVLPDHMAHFAREDELKRRVRKFEYPRAAENHHRAGSIGRGPGLGLVGNHEFESPDALAQVRGGRRPLPGSAGGEGGAGGVRVIPPPKELGGALENPPAVEEVISRFV